MITVKIDDREIQLEKPVTILEAAKAAGIKIPTLCYFEGLEKFGGCRLCLVEVEKLPRLQTACTVMVTDGMTVKTETEQIVKARRAMLEFLLINHPLECPYCDKAGECELQDLVAKYGPTAGRFAEGKRTHPENFDDSIIVRNMERCVMCTRCVRMCQGQQGAYAITVTGRGGHSFVEPFSGGKYNCEYCGNCLTVCPVGAIMSRLHRHSYRSWFVEKEIQTVCGYCGVGCSMVLQMRENGILRSVPKIGLGVNKGLLCSRGRFGYDVVESKKRLTTPLVRKNGELSPASWDEALGVVASRLAEIKERAGGETIAGIASARCTNEDNYVFQRFFRETLSSNNIDSLSRLFYAPAQDYFEEIFGQGITANVISGVGNSEAVLIAGGDPTKINPVLGLQVRAARRNGAGVISLCDADGLKRFITTGLVSALGSENVLFASLLKAIIDLKGLPGRLPSIEKQIETLKWPDAGEISGAGLKQEEIEAAAGQLKDVKNVSMVVGPDLIAYGGMRCLFLAAALSYVLDARIYLMSVRPNEQGIADTGCLPGMLPGGRPIGVSSFREKFEKEVGYSIPSREGVTLPEMIERMEIGRIKALYVMGDNPVFNMPSAHRTREALSKLEFLVVQDIFLSETGHMADVVLPAAAWSEKEGTFTNLERRIQKLNKAKNPVAGLDDWMILAKVGRLMGSRMEFGKAEDVWSEITRASHLYGPLKYDELGGDQALWPYKGEPLRGTGQEVRLPDDENGKQKGKYRIYPERSRFHSGTMSRYSAALNSIQSEPFASMGPATAADFGVKDGDRVKISVDGQSLELLCRVDAGIADSSIRIPNAFEGVCVMSLVTYDVDAHSKAPVFRQPELKIEKVS